MIAAIAKILNAQIGNLPWIERRAALVAQAQKPSFVTDQDGAQKATGQVQIYPVACDVNQAQCWENGTYKYLIPDTSVASLSFFIDNGGATVKSVEGPKLGLIRFAFDLRFVCWMNVQKLGSTDCNFSAKAVPFVISRLMGSQSPVGVFDGGIEEQIYKNMTVNSIRQMVKTPAIFEPFFFALEGAKRGVFLFPFDYFGLNITGTFDIAKNCLPDLVPPDFTFTDETCKPE